MIGFEQVSKAYAGRAKKVVLRSQSFVFPRGRNVGVLGANGAGKSTLLRMISGAELPDEGRIHRAARVSFPLGFTGNFHANLTGNQNARFVARIYGEDVRRVLAFVSDFSELGAYLDMPVSTYSSGMMAKLAFGLSLAIEFETYLVDEVTEVGDARFRAKCHQAFQDRIARSHVIMVSHNSQTIRKFCDAGAVLDSGVLTFYPTVEAAMQAYQRIMGVFNA
jgi:capsular polysaccharide transport system ATP-binding protein